MKLELQSKVDELKGDLLAAGDPEVSIDVLEQNVAKLKDDIDKKASGLESFA